MIILSRVICFVVFQFLKQTSAHQMQESVGSTLTASEAILCQFQRISEKSLSAHKNTTSVSLTPPCCQTVHRSKLLPLWSCWTAINDHTSVTHTCHHIKKHKKKKKLTLSVAQNNSNYTTQVTLTLPCFHLRLHWRGAVSQPGRGPELRGEDLCSQNSPAGLEEQNTGSHPPLAGRWSPSLTDPPAPLPWLCQHQQQTHERHTHTQVAQRRDTMEKGIHYFKITNHIPCVCVCRSTQSHQ